MLQVNEATSYKTVSSVTANNELSIHDYGDRNFKDLTRRIALSTCTRALAILRDMITLSLFFLWRLYVFLYRNWFYKSALLTLQ